MNVAITFRCRDQIGLVHHTIRMKTTTLAICQEFLEETCNTAPELFTAADLILFIYDDTCPHINARVPPAFNNITITCVQPDSPFLNPVE